MKQLLTEEPFAAFIGIDWADAKHDLCLQAAGCENRESSTLEHTPEAIAAWARGLRRRFSGQPVAICLELNKGPLVHALSQYDFMVLFPVNPLMVARFREAFATSGAKDDPSDAQLQLELLRKHRDRLKPLEPASPALRALAQLVEHRRRLVADKVCLNNRISSVLKNYFPQVLVWFKDRDTDLFCDFLTRWPTLQALPGAGPALAPRLLVAFGEQRERYTSAADLQKYAGIAPVLERSGNQYSVHWRWRCPKFLRQTFVEWSGKSIQHSFWARAYYEQQRARGKSHQAVVRALAFKWIRILYRCWQDRRPYDESVYLRALQRRGSPLLKHLANAS